MTLFLPLFRLIEGLNLDKITHRSYAAEYSKPCSSAIYRWRSHSLMPDESGNYNRDTIKSKTLGTEEFVVNADLRSLLKCVSPNTNRHKAICPNPCKLTY